MDSNGYNTFSRASSNHRIGERTPSHSPRAVPALTCERAAMTCTRLAVRRQGTPGGVRCAAEMDRVVLGYMRGSGWCCGRLGMTRHVTARARLHGASERRRAALTGEQILCACVPIYRVLENRFRAMADCFVALDEARSRMQCVDTVVNRWTLNA